MQQKVTVLNQTVNWNEIKRPRVGDVVTWNNARWQNITGVNSEPSDVSSDWIFIGSVSSLIPKEFIKSNGDLSQAQRNGGVLYGILDQYTGEEITLFKVTGTPTVDGIIYFQLGTEYFKRVYSDYLNVRWWGADQLKTASQNHTAIMAAVNYGLSINICDIRFPNIINGVSYKSDPIVVPAFAYNIGGTKTLKFSGDAEPSQFFGTVGTYPFLTFGSVIECTSTTGDLLSFTGSTGEFGFGFTNIKFVAENMEFRTYQNSQINALNCRNATQMILKNVQVTNGVYSVDSVEPTYETTGICTPKNLNNALTILDNVSVSGFRYGIEVSEHTDARGLNLTCNYYGLNFVTADHASYFGLVDAQRNRYAIKVSGNHTFEIAQLNLEHAGAGQTTPTNEWQVTQADVYDPDNHGRGRINWTSVMGGVGTDPTGFKRTGGNSIKYVNMYNPRMETGAGYDDGEYKIDSNDFSVDSRAWRFRTDIAEYGDLAIQQANDLAETGWSDRLKFTRDGYGKFFRELAIEPATFPDSAVQKRYVDDFNVQNTDMTLAPTTETLNSTYPSAQNFQRVYTTGTSPVYTCVKMPSGTWVITPGL